MAPTFRSLMPTMRSNDALQQLKAARQRQRNTSAASQHLAASSHDETEQYVQHFEQAFSKLAATDADDRSHSSDALQSGQLHALAAQASGSIAKKGPLSSSNCSIMISRSGGVAANQGQRTPVRPHSRQHPKQCTAGPPPPAAAADQAACQVHGVAAVAQGWRSGPVDPAGVVVQLSDRPGLCSARLADGSGDVVVGSSDHALYVLDVRRGRKGRTLYSKTTGHTEWVTCVCSLPGGRVLSGGMDGRLWLWPAAGGSGCEVKAAHSAPVSKVAMLTPTTTAATSGSSGSSSDSLRRLGSSSSSGSGSSRRVMPSYLPAATAAAAAGPVLAVSCSYDKTVKLWDVSRGQQAQAAAVLGGHAGPVLELAVAPAGDLLLTGDRKGGIICWDAGAAASTWAAQQAHDGHVTALAWLQRTQQQQQQQQQQTQAGSSSSSSTGTSCGPPLWLSGGQDGYLRAWDGRQGSCVVQQPLHADSRGRGAIGDIVTVACGSRLVVVTAGADQTLKVCDVAAGYAHLMHTIKLTDFPYSLAALGGGLVACGCGDGLVHVVDVMQGTTLYALGAGRAAVRCIEVDYGSLVCAGDDGCVTCYTFA